MTIIRQRQLNLDGPPEAIVTRLEDMPEIARLRRRAILVRKTDGQWKALIVVVQAHLQN